MSELKAKTNDQYVAEALKKGLLPLETYIDRKTTILHKCILCGKEFNVTPRAVLIKTKYGCRGCGQRDTQESFTKKMKEIHPNIEVIGKYVDSKTKIRCRCLLDGYEWEQRPNDLLQGIGCSRCNNYERISNEDFQIEFYSKNNTIELLSEYVNNRTPILCRCKIDGFEWYAYANDLLKGRSGCKKCAGCAPYTTETFREAMRNIDDTIIIIGEYVNSKTPLECECRICGTHWMAQPSNLKNNHTGCPNCVPNSKLENLVEQILKDYNIKYIPQYKFVDLKGVGGRSLSFDFYLPKYNVLIECQGRQHNECIEYFGGEEKFKIQQEHDKRKREYAKLHNINLLEIWYYDINKIEEILYKALGLGNSLSA